MPSNQTETQTQQRPNLGQQLIIVSLRRSHRLDTSKHKSNTETYISETNEHPSNQCTKGIYIYQYPEPNSAGQNECSSFSMALDDCFCLQFLMQE